MRLCFLSLALTIALAGAPVAAQDLPANDTRSFSVTASYQVQVPFNAAAQTADWAKSIAEVTQRLGNLADRECEVLSATFKAECHIAQLNIGTNVSDRRFRQGAYGDFGDTPKTISASLNATYALRPADAPKPTP